MPNPVQALIVGAGISGLTTAFALRKAGIDARIVDGASRPGGLIQSVRRDGYLVECGPQSFSGNASLTSICRDLEILDRRILADSKAPRFVLINGALEKVPLGPGLLVSPLMGGGTRTALFRDVIGRSEAPDSDESVASFIRRKFSPTLLDRLVGPFVSGIYAGDPEKLSLRAAFPILYEAEQTSGSVLRGLLKVMKARKAKRGPLPREKPTLQTFREGNDTLVRALAEKLGAYLSLEAEVISIRPLDPGREPKTPRFRVGLHTPSGAEFLETERLVLAVPTDRAGKLLAPLGRAFESQLRTVDYSGVAVVSLGYRKEDVGHPLDGFGFLVPRSSGLTVLGTVWNSSLFPGRAPGHHVLLTSFVGGATNPDATKQPADQLVALVHREIKPLMQLREGPVFSNVSVWPRALPQYNLGHTARMAAINNCRADFPGLYLTGNYMNGPAIGACVEQALKVADEIRVSFAN
ncbi:MAG TPA: protoporphyrinogen oxidase [Candidatus Acidoferrum sp.]|jgi:oxygen-dependent protoporphyrinogen oxidase|nr:protoporphyrinogen oxidase [Candidatus Acidoferrum sp.]